MVEKEDLGEMVYDTHPSYSKFPYEYILPIIIIGILFFFIYIFDLFSKFSWLWYFYTIYLFSICGISVLLLQRNHQRVQIFRRGIFFYNTVKTKNDPYTILSTGFTDGKHSITFDELVAIIPFQGKLFYHEFLGLQIILSKINDKYIVGTISISKKKESEYFKIKSCLIKQMKDYWNKKYIEKEIIF